jgi:undecaprenyl diphosphate synthase
MSLEELALQREKLPHHIAIIMDGNGRWALARGLERVEGHLHGMDTVRTIVEECSRLNLGQLTLFCFSSENWKRPQPELDFLMALLQQYLLQEREEIMRQNIRFRVIGRRQGLSQAVLDEIDENTQLSSTNTGMTLALAINYGSRTEIVDAVQSIAQRIEEGKIQSADIDEKMISDSLYTQGMPDPDLLIRTAGEMRISNFLLWQISYAELWVTPKCWPDFDKELLYQALRDYASRERRFGGLLPPTTS